MPTHGDVINHRFLCPALVFEPLSLSEDDKLPTDIELVMGYRGIIPIDHCAAAMQRGLPFFPHLSGRMIHDAQLQRTFIIPASGELQMEVVESNEVTSIADWESMPLRQQSSAFIPQQRNTTEAGSLFGIRLTHMHSSGLSVIGMRVSHAAVDGTGLALFIHHCTTPIRGVDGVTLYHKRKYGFGTHLDGPDEIPYGYEMAYGNRASVWTDDVLTHSMPVVFVIPVGEVKKHFDVVSILDARLHLGAWLCLHLAQLHTQYEELALWCDARGTNGIPATYTGNVGCFLHFPLSQNERQKLTQQLRSVASRGGFQIIADTYRNIKQAEARGHPLQWSGASKNILQLNFVPHAVAVTDFGYGLPSYALLLSRNSSGLRIALSVDASCFLIESCLPDGLGNSLVEACRAAQMNVSMWCHGPSRI